MPTKHDDQVILCLSLRNTRIVLLGPRSLLNRVHGRANRSAVAFLAHKSLCYSTHISTEPDT
jgi:hypothetical protein